MVKPVDSMQPLGGEGNEKYNPEQKRGPGAFDEALEKEKAERARAEISKIAEEHKAKTEAERPRTYTERLQDMGRLPKPTGGVSGGGGGMGTGKMNRDITKNYKKGGAVKSASARADGCCIRGKTRA
jgi:hypothetical protein